MNPMLLVAGIGRNKNYMKRDIKKNFGTKILDATNIMKITTNKIVSTKHVHSYQGVRDGNYQHVYFDSCVRFFVYIVAIYILIGSLIRHCTTAFLLKKMQIIFLNI